MRQFRDFSLWLRATIIVVLTAGIIAVWLWTPLRDYTDAAALAGLAEFVRSSPYATAIVLGTFIVGGLVFFPLTAPVVATALMFPPWQAFWLASAGTILSALVGFLVGHLLGAAPLRRFAGDSVNRLSLGAGRHGILLITTLRLMPIAHFSMINLIAGASHVRLRDYVIGTVLGCVPGIAVIAVIGDRAQQFLHDPNLWSFTLLAGVVAAGLLALNLLKRRLRSRRPGP